MTNLVNLHCGAVGIGKTKQYIKPQIEAALADKDNLILHVVVSIKAQEEAKLDFPSAHVINCEDDKIVSAVGEAYSCITDISRTTRHLIITHAAYLRLNQIPALANWILFIDEAIKVYRPVTYDNTILSKKTIGTKEQPMMDWSALFTKGNETGFGYHEVLNTIDRTDPIIRESETLMKLSDPNWKTEIHTSDYAKFGKERHVIEFVQYLDSDLMKSFKEVHIVGANIDKLMMGKWLVNEGFTFGEHIPFEKRSGTKINLYTTNMKNSKTLQQKDKSYLNDFRTKFDDVIGSTPSLRLANTINKAKVGENYTRLKHNMHSQNGYRDSHNTVLFESALNASKRFVNWLECRHNISSQVVFDTLTVDPAYQLLGRTCYRKYDNDRDVTMGIPCARTALRLVELFLDENDVDITVFETKAKRKETEHTEEFKEKQEKKPAKDAAQRNREYRARKKAAKEAELVQEVFGDMIQTTQPIEPVVEPVVEVVEIIVEQPVEKELTEQEEPTKLTGMALLHHMRKVKEVEQGWDFTTKTEITHE